ncbi:hypothetical protein ABZ897_19065 [Nonomuraea sp. NPDC046802]|uniref:hypothetical protein n=1 Tax=Nonomuraea sp. NPDC046802 TaxID=3154919 RepID=UPI0033E04B99
MNDIDRLVKAIDRAPRPPAQGSAARELRAAIMETPQRRWKVPRRLPVLLSAVTAVAAAVAIGVGLPAYGPATEYANAAVSLARADDYVNVTITDPTADYREFEEAFRAVGLNVRVKVIPVAPDEVGQLIGPIVPEGFKGPGSVGVTRTPCQSAFCGKVWLPAGLKQLVVFGVGRAAEPGEPYAEDRPYDVMYGEEAVKGYTSRGKTVADVRAELRRRGLKAAYRLLWRDSDGAGFFDQIVSADQIKDDWIVDGTRFRSSDAVDLYVTPGPGTGPRPDPLKVRTPQWYDLTD